MSIPVNLNTFFRLAYIEVEDFNCNMEAFSLGLHKLNFLRHCVTNYDWLFISINTDLMQ